MGRTEEIQPRPPLRSYSTSHALWYVLSVSLNRGPCLYLQQKRNTQNGCGSGAGRGSEKNTKKEATLGTDGLLQGGMGKSEILLSAREPQSPTALGHMIYIHYAIGQWWAREHLPKCNRHAEWHCEDQKSFISALDGHVFPLYAQEDPRKWQRQNRLQGAERAKNSKSPFRVAIESPGSDKPIAVPPERILRCLPGQTPARRPLSSRR